ncbi:uncharacterized protein LOC125107886 isoform X1 [Lutra lutra]|uniref:uncharacterized protein LOC125107886 isoform X1 n=1 Tax=Lutra lutra TaxID=9657 RepID=UPI001FD4E72B|nr:uncharacterized protein LOC125107886 isoform X1 [Lutra lutra]
MAQVANKDQVGNKDQLASKVQVTKVIPVANKDQLASKVQVTKVIPVANKDQLPSKNQVANMAQVPRETSREEMTSMVTPVASDKVTLLRRSSSDSLEMDRHQLVTMDCSVVEMWPFLSPTSNHQ